MKKSGIISSGSKASTEAASEIIQNGGNAFDATIAGILMAMFSEPGLTSPGGGGFLMAYPENRKPILFDFFVNMPFERTDNPDFFSVDVDFGDTQQQFHIGKGSVAIPGNIAGLFHVHNKLGKIPFREIALPAIHAAKNGILLNKFQAYCLEILKPILCNTIEGKNIFCSENELLKEGDIFKMKEFSDFLDILSIEGENFFYKGEISSLILESQLDGGLIKRKDFDSYSVVERNPIITEFYDYQVLGNPPPAVSGVLVDFTLKLLNSRNKKEVSISELAYAFKMTNLARKEFEQNRIKNLNQIFEKYNDLFLTNLLDNPSDDISENIYGSTTHISVIDKDGNAASATTTNGEGCGYIIPHTGFMLNNMLGEHDLNPNGFFKHIPGARLPTMVSPTIVLKNGKPVLVTGTAGSNRIRSVIVQMIVNTLCNGMDVDDATSYPRIHLENNILHAEPGIPNEELDKLSKYFKIKKWHNQNIFFGGANSIYNNKGMGDPRRSGFTLTL